MRLSTWPRICVHFAPVGCSASKIAAIFPLYHRCHDGNNGRSPAGGEEEGGRLGLLGRHPRLEVAERRLDLLVDAGHLVHLWGGGGDVGVRMCEPSPSNLAHARSTPGESGGSQRRPCLTPVSCQPSFCPPTHLRQIRLQLRLVQIRVHGREDLPVSVLWDDWMIYGGCTEEVV